MRGTPETNIKHRQPLSFSYRFLFGLHLYFKTSICLMWSPKFVQRMFPKPGSKSPYDVGVSDVQTARGVQTMRRNFERHEVQVFPLLSSDTHFYKAAWSKTIKPSVGELRHQYSEILLEISRSNDALERGDIEFFITNVLGCPTCQVLLSIASARERGTRRATKAFAFYESFSEICEPLSRMYMDRNDDFGPCQDTGICIPGWCLW